MASLFSKDPAARPRAPRYAIERIQKEIDHLKNRSSVRYGAQRNLARARVIGSFTLCALLWLYFMDPILYAFHKRDAMRIYLYLHNYGSDQKTTALIATGILSDTEINDLNRRQGNFQDYFSTPQSADQEADSTIRYLNGLYYLRTGQYDFLDPVGKLRYLLFVRFGFLPPTYWNVLNPTTTE